MFFNVGFFVKCFGMDNIDLNDMFNFNIVFKFGNYYLNYLKKEFNYFFFVVYVYNVGFGFLRRWLESFK